MPSDRCSTTFVVAVLLGVLLLNTGCDLFQRTRVEESILEAHPGSMDDFDFWDALADQSVVSNDDALHSLILIQDGTDPSPNFQARMALSAQKGWLIGTPTPLEANESATVGLLSVAACEILGIEGGLTMRLMGPSPRYSTRELSSMGMLPGLTPNEALSGLEFIAFVGNIEQRMQLQEAWADLEEIKAGRNVQGDDQ